MEWNESTGPYSIYRGDYFVQLMKRYATNRKNLY